MENMSKKTKDLLQAILAEVATIRNLVEPKTGEAESEPDGKLEVNGALTGTMLGSAGISINSPAGLSTDEVVDRIQNSMTVIGSLNPDKIKITDSRPNLVTTDMLEELSDRLDALEADVTNASMQATIAQSGVNGLEDGGEILELWHGTPNITEDISYYIVNELRKDIAARIEESGMFKCHQILLTSAEDNYRDTVVVFALTVTPKNTYRTLQRSIDTAINSATEYVVRKYQAEVNFINAEREYKGFYPEGDNEDS